MRILYSTDGNYSKNKPTQACIHGQVDHVDQYEAIMSISMSRTAHCAGINRILK